MFLCFDGVSSHETALARLAEAGGYATAQDLRVLPGTLSALRARGYARMHPIDWLTLEPRPRYRITLRGRLLIEGWKK